MTNRPITEIAELVERFTYDEAQREDTRPGYYEIAVTDADQPYLVRWMAGNEEQVWRTSENYAEPDDAVHAIGLLPGGRSWLTSYAPRVVDERTPASDFDMNPE